MHGEVWCSCNQRWPAQTEHLRDRLTQLNRSRNALAKRLDRAEKALRFYAEQPELLIRAHPTTGSAAGGWAVENGMTARAYFAAAEAEGRG